MFFLFVCFVLKLDKGHQYDQAQQWRFNLLKLNSIYHKVKYVQTPSCLSEDSVTEGEQTWVGVEVPIFIYLLFR